jgi:hypothetical protein
MTAMAMTDEPTTMFVDGPTGFVFTYGLEASWKYVGRVGDTKPCPPTPPTGCTPQEIAPRATR